jgi:predicted nucleotidyltransferase component of viral defense system
MDADFFATVRRTTIIALFADDALAGMLALKGGNALSLVYGITNRTSVDLDFSMKEDFPDFPDARGRIFRVLKDRFDSAGYVVFDEKLTPKPRIDGEDLTPWWGGYELNFKIIKKERYKELIHTKPGKLRIEAAVTGPGSKRVFKVDFSKFENIDGKEEHEMDHYSIYVYTPEMIVLEKLRAICQQMPEYTEPRLASARARDFFDIHEAIEKRSIDLTNSANLELLRLIFNAKQVPLSLLLRIGDTREFHRPDWPSVVTSVAGGSIEGFDFYFDFVLRQIERLKAVGVV